MSKRTTALAALAMAGVVALTGCSAAETPRPTASTTPAPTAALREAVVESTSLASCATDPGVVEATGTVTVSRGGNLLLVVTWETKDEKPVAAGTAVMRDLAGDEEHEWTVRTTLPDGATDVDCRVAAYPGLPRS